MAFPVICGWKQQPDALLYSIHHITLFRLGPRPIARLTNQQRPGILLNIFLVYTGNYTVGNVLSILLYVLTCEEIDNKATTTTTK